MPRGKKCDPLTDEHCALLDAAMRATPEIRDMLERCERVGMKCDAAREMLEANQRTAEAIKREFFPDRV